MLKNSKAFSAFSANDIPKVKEFYGLGRKTFFPLSNKRERRDVSKTYKTEAKRHENKRKTEA
jgi:hypothetical protein